MKTLLTVPEAARRLNCTTKYIYDLCWSGRLGKKVVGRWRIPVAEIEARLKQRAMRAKL